MDGAQCIPVIADNSISYDVRFVSHTDQRLKNARTHMKNVCEKESLDDACY